MISFKNEVKGDKNSTMMHVLLFERETSAGWEVLSCGHSRPHEVTRWSPGPMRTLHNQDWLRDLGRPVWTENTGLPVELRISRMWSTATPP